MVRSKTSTGSSWRGWSKSGREGIKASTTAWWWRAFCKLNASWKLSHTPELCGSKQNKASSEKGWQRKRGRRSSRDASREKPFLFLKIYVNQNLKQLHKQKLRLFLPLISSLISSSDISTDEIKETSKMIWSDFLKRIRTNSSAR